MTERFTDGLGAPLKPTDPRFDFFWLHYTRSRQIWGHNSRIWSLFLKIRCHFPRKSICTQILRSKSIFWGNGSDFLNENWFSKRTSVNFWMKIDSHCQIIAEHWFRCKLITSNRFFGERAVIFLMKINFPGKLRRIFLGKSICFVTFYIYEYKTVNFTKFPRKIDFYRNF